MITGPMMIAGQIPHTDMTPLAHLFNEYVGFAVRADSAIKSGRDLAERLRKDPGALSISLSTALTGSNHLATVLALKAAGVHIKRLEQARWSRVARMKRSVIRGRAPRNTLRAFRATCRRTCFSDSRAIRVVPRHFHRQLCSPLQQPDQCRHIVQRLQPLA